nr:hypothetical protein [Tanacetum cinerariifolium]
MATSERADRLLALEALAACLPFSEVVSLGPAAAVREVIVVLELLLVFRTLALGLGEAAEHQTIACSDVWIPARSWRTCGHPIASSPCSSLE